MKVIRLGVSLTHVCPGYVVTEIRQIDKQGVFHRDWQDNISPMPFSGRSLVEGGEMIGVREFRQL